MPSINRKAGSIKGSSGVSSLVPTLEPRVIQLSLISLYHGPITALVQLTQGQTYVATNQNVGGDLWSFTLLPLAPGLWGLQCSSPTANGGTPGYVNFAISQNNLPLDARETRLNWYVDTFDAEVYFNEFEIRVLPATPNIYPQSS